MKNLRPFTLLALAILFVFTTSGCATVKKGWNKVFSSKPAKADAIESDSSSIHLTKITYSSTAKGTIVKVFSNRKFGYTSYKLSDPLRLAVEIPEVALDFDPKRIGVNQENVSHISVVRFPKVNSVRVEMELTADMPYKITQKGDYLEVFITGLTSSDSSSASRKSSADKEKIARLNEKVQKLNRENDNLKMAPSGGNNTTLALEEENALLKDRLNETKRRLSESDSMTQALDARLQFMEKKISELQVRVAGKPSAPAVASELPSPIASPTLASATVSDLSSEEVRQAVNNWLAAWNNKDVYSFASHYSPQFNNRGMDLNAWVEDKKAKFDRPGTIRVSAENIRVSVNGSKATVLFRQVFKSESYRDKGSKTLTLTQEAGAWKIISEVWEPL